MNICFSHPLMTCSAKQLLHRVTSMVPAMLIMFLMLLCTGCSSSGAGQMEIISQNNQGVSMVGNFTTGIYRFDDHNQITMLLIDGDVDSPRQAVTVRMFWAPKAGRTPIDRTATNATIHYVIFPDEQGSQVGIYSGAGFLFPKGTPGDDSLTLEIWQSTLRLTDSTEGFKDLLGPADLKGTITLKEDGVALERAMRQLNVAVRKSIGYPRLVEANGEYEPVASNR